MMLYPLLFGIAVLLSWILTQITIRLARRYGIVDDPKRKHGAIIHKELIPRAGGVPVYVATALVIGFQLLIMGGESFPIHRVWALLLAGLVIVVVGVLDDKYDLSPRLRLGIQFLCALIVVWSGVGVSFVSNPFGEGVIRFDQLAWQYSFWGEIRTFFVIANVIALFWIVGLMNMVNWSSGMDGQNAGISVVALLVLGFAALREGLDSQTVAMLAFVGAGAYLGFLYWSAYPQKIMPGFGGSTWSGFLIAVLAIMSGAKFATAAIVLAVPVLDAVWVGVRRIMRGQNPMKNDRTHLHHYLLDLGWSKPQVVWFYWGISAILGILVLGLGTLSKFIFFVMLAIIFIAFSLWLRWRLLSLKQ